MRAFTTVTSVPAPFPLSNVDTDTIVPARFMKTLLRTGLGSKLFYDLRYDAGGNERGEFVLNRPPYRRAEILVAYENFGCGSSREHAPWALLDFGIRCIVAPSFGDIFASNCYKNGVLPVTLPHAACTQLIASAAAGMPVTVDLQREVVIGPADEPWEFRTDAFRRSLLLEGHDEIEFTLRHHDTIAAYEARRADTGTPCPRLVGTDS